jgi:hypothetical protein
MDLEIDRGRERENGCFGGCGCWVRSHFSLCWVRSRQLSEPQYGQSSYLYTFIRGNRSGPIFENVFLGRFSSLTTRHNLAKQFSHSPTQLSPSSLLLCNISNLTSHTNMPTPPLPTELWLSIIMHLDDPVFLFRKCRLVSRTFNSCVKTYFHTHFIPKHTHVEYATTTMMHIRMIGNSRRFGMFSHYSADGGSACYKLSGTRDILRRFREPQLSVVFEDSSMEEQKYESAPKCRTFWTYPLLDMFQAGSPGAVASRWVFDEEDGIVEVECRFLLDLFLS